MYINSDIVRLTPAGLAEQGFGGFAAAAAAISEESELGGVNKLRLAAGWRAGDKHPGFIPQNAEQLPGGHSRQRLEFLRNVCPGE